MIWHLTNRLYQTHSRSVFIEMSPSEMCATFLRKYWGKYIRGKVYKSINLDTVRWFNDLFITPLPNLLNLTIDLLQMRFINQYQIVCGHFIRLYCSKVMSIVFRIFYSIIVIISSLRVFDLSLNFLFT